ncbi:MAG: hypothetical protein GY800_02635 [Planctomycetes bacterium]|nr:hypothetical protein [Planctomycetota bacterium]
MKEGLTREELEKLLREVRVEIAEAAHTVQIPRKSLPDEFKSTLASYSYYKCEFGMNVVLPKKTFLEELRFRVNLTGDGKRAANRVVALDGWPKSTIKETKLAKGKVNIGISKALQIVPVVGDVASNILNASFQWEYEWVLKEVEVSFSGGLTTAPAWYLHKGNINKAFIATVILKKKKPIKRVIGKTKASWSIRKRGWREPLTIDGDEKNLSILPV